MDRIFFFDVCLYGIFNILSVKENKTKGRNKMAAIMRLALGVLMVFSDCVGSNIIELSVSKAAKKGDMVAKCGCSDLDCSFSGAFDSQGFDISKSGNIILAKDAVSFEQETLPVLVKTKDSCYTNMAAEQKFIIHIVDSSNSVSMSSPILHSSMLNDFPALVGTVESLTPPGGETDQYKSFHLLGPLSEHFKVKINSANEVEILKEPSFLKSETFSTFLFILVFKSERQTYYYNAELFIGSDIEDSEDRYISVQESHDVMKRQISTVVPRNVAKNISVYENNTGVLFNILDNPSQNNGMSFEILEALPEDIFQIDADGNVTLKDGARLDYDKGHRVYTIRIEVKSELGGQGIFSDSMETLRKYPLQTI